MSVGMVILLALFSALWIVGLLDQLHSFVLTMRYLVLSLVLVAVGVYKYTRRRK